MLNNANVKEYVENNKDKVQLKEFKEFPGLGLLKYKRHVFYDNLWDEYLEDMRGTVVALEDFTPIAMPFKKIYNHKENKAEIAPNEMVTAVTKINGFMVALTYVPEVDKVLVSTTGSLDSDFVEYAKDYITEELLGKIKLMFLGTGTLTTFLFECVHPKDPHIIKEKKDGLYLLGMREVLWNGEEVNDQEFLDEVAKALGDSIMRPMWILDSFANIEALVKNVKHEGFVVHGKEVTLKLKSPFYLISKFLGRMKDEKFQTWFDNGVLKEKVDEEFYPLVDYLYGSADFKTMTEQEKIAFIQGFLNQ